MANYANYYQNNMPQYQVPAYVPQTQPYSKIQQFQQNMLPTQMSGANQQFQQVPNGISGKVVPAVENITANDVPMDGSIAFFPRQDMSEIYAKSWNADGTIRTIVFKPVLDPDSEKGTNIPQTDLNVLYEDVRALRGKISERFDRLEKSMAENLAKERGTNRLKFDVPDWVPSIGGKSFGFSISNISATKISYLASGGVVTQYTPAVIGEAGAEAVLPLTNKTAMSMIADSILENANLGSYASNDYLNQVKKATYGGTLQAIKEAGGITAEATFRVEGDPNGLFKVTKKQAYDYYKRTGGNAFVF